MSEKYRLGACTCMHTRIHTRATRVKTIKIISNFRFYKLRASFLIKVDFW